MIREATAARRAGDWPEVLRISGVRDLTRLPQFWGADKERLLADLSAFAPDYLRTLLLHEWQATPGLTFVLSSAFPADDRPVLLARTIRGEHGEFLEVWAGRRTDLSGLWYDLPLWAWHAGAVEERRRVYAATGRQAMFSPADGGASAVGLRIDVDRQRHPRTPSWAVQESAALVEEARHLAARHPHLTSFATAADFGAPALRVRREKGDISGEAAMSGTPGEVVKEGVPCEVVAEGAQRKVATGGAPGEVAAEGAPGELAAEGTPGEDGPWEGAPGVVGTGGVVAVPLVSVVSLEENCQLRGPDAGAVRAPREGALVRAGVVGPGEVHPLAFEALFPGREQDFTGPRHETVTPVRVRCGGQWHLVEIVGASLRVRDHDEREVERELMLEALGGAPPVGCARALRGFRGGGRGTPKLIRRWRHDFLGRWRHGDRSVERDVAAGRDPLLRDEAGRAVF